MQQPLRLVIAVTIALLAGAPLEGQQAPDAAGSEAPVCYGFSFGRWTPALDWRAAGHPDPRRASDPADVAPQDRRWAVESDSLLMLFPSWWPAGVSVALPRRPRTLADTVSGRAVALVPDYRMRAPAAPVRAWGVRCGGG